jgi:integrase/recombinase XerC
MILKYKMMDFSSLVDKFLFSMQAVKNASEHTIRNYRIDLAAFQQFLSLNSPEPICPQQVTKWSVRKYLSHLHSQGSAKKTILRRISSLRSFFKYLVVENVIKESPLKEFQAPKLDKKLPVSITVQEIECLFAQPELSSYLGHRDRVIMELFYSSGLRVSELAGLNRQDVDFSSLSVRVLGKGKKQRVVPITASAAKWLQSYLESPSRIDDSEEHKRQVDEKAIFLNKWGKRITVRSIDRKFDEYLKASGLGAKVTPHT